MCRSRPPFAPAAQASFPLLWQSPERRAGSDRRAGRGGHDPFLSEVSPRPSLFCGPRARRQTVFRRERWIRPIPRPTRPEANLFRKLLRGIYALSGSGPGPGSQPRRTRKLWAFLVTAAPIRLPPFHPPSQENKKLSKGIDKSGEPFLLFPHVTPNRAKTQGPSSNRAALSGEPRRISALSSQEGG